MRNTFLLFGLLFVNSSLLAQNELTDVLKTHVSFLAHDSLEGRATGSNGEMLAARYIANQYKWIGLQPTPDGSENYLDAFTAKQGRKVADNNFLEICAQKITPGAHTYPHPMSSNGTATAKVEYVSFGISAAHLQHDDYAAREVKGKIALIKFASPDSDNPHAALAEFADERMKIKTAAEKGAVAVIFFSDDSTHADPGPDYSKNINPENIPVYVVDQTVAQQLLSCTHDITLSVELNPVIMEGHNVLGYIDNGAVHTVVIGAHYDHLGHGEAGGSLHRGSPAIHNGADDNASGVAVMLELARKLKSSSLKNNNYLFIAFSGEEMGLLGSHDFVNSDVMQNLSVNYMLNFDMVGRLDAADNPLVVNGVGTSPAWSVVKTADSKGLHIKTTLSGIGPSDHTSFYLKNIPVLFFFTGTHADYHKPSDDIEKINFEGMNKIVHYAYDIIADIDGAGKLLFTKTSDEKNENTPSFKVTLGVVPDYAYEGTGMRIDGVTDGKPASKAGLLAGDIVIRLGSYPVADMMSYMKALGKFSKGETTTVTVLRNASEHTFSITF